MTEYAAEFIGIMILIIFGSGVVDRILLKNSKAENTGWITLCVAWVLEVSFAVFAVVKISGAHINPAVTPGFAMAGKFPWAIVPGYILSQVAGAFSGAVILYGYNTIRTGKRQKTLPPNWEFSAPSLHDLFPITWLVR